MDTVRVSPEGLHLLAARCVEAAGELTMDRPVALAGPPYQPTSAEVGATCEALADASDVLAARLQATGGKVVAAACGYRLQDDSSGHAIAALGAAVEA